MNIETFWNLFAEQVYLEIESDKNWFSTYDGWKTWTKVLEAVMQAVGLKLSYIGKEIKIIPQHTVGRYRYDACYGTIKDNNYDIDFAIEFENHQRDWETVELPKLLNTKATYKVLISYYYTKNHSFDDIKYNLSVDYKNNKLQGIDNNFLFIFGPTTTKISVSDCKKLDLRAFKFQDGQFVNMPDIEIFRKLC